jgi:DNA-binding NarL/FixJ family response regulator
VLDGSHVNKTVLIADDDPGVRRLLTVLIDEGAFEVVAQATDGVEAVSLATRHHPAVVILDREMSRIDGGATARLLRDLAPDTKVVACSEAARGKPEWADELLPREALVDVEIVLDRALGAG